MITLKNVYKEYQLDGETFTALKNISLQIKEGDFISIIGPSGSGKSTLMHIIGLLDTATKGKLLVEERDVSSLSDTQLSKLRSEFVGFVFQQFNLINKLTVLENVLLPKIYLRNKIDFNQKDRALGLMERFGISEKMKSYPNKLSGGEQQRVAIARALINNPRLILADEPTGNLDTQTGQEIMKLLSDLNRRDKLTVVVVTHEKDVAKYARRKIFIKDGKIAK